MRLISSGDVRLALHEEGDAARPAILLLHGYPDTSRVWDEVAALLRDRFRVVRYDVRGAGRSSAPRDRRHYTFDHLAADLAAVLEAVGAPRVHLVGHDWGSIQLWEALSRPAISQTAASFTSIGGPGLDQAAHFFRYGERRAVLGQLARSWYIGCFQAPLLPELVWRTLGPRLLGRTLRKEGVRPRPGHPAQTLARDAANGLGLYRTAMRGRLRRAGDPRVPVPVQLIETTRDPFVSPRLLATLARWAPACWRREVAAGHWVQRSHPGVVARMVAEFVTHVDGGPPSPELRRSKAPSFPGKPSIGR
ncbi:alpha/beta fold hydrolase [Thermoactinospora rubra]|uniref:alpha/beta fold hydrolase n=1 Tax=Thermoactinospora rubra TaxID=1088767 RepID=UPI000A0F99A3|nr:alpha/beta fold hydrolase [Thermoactinospora rubra]